MDNIFKIEKLIEQSKLQRFFNLSPKQNAIIEVNNLLASRPLKELTVNDIVGISEKYNVNLRRRFIERLKQLYLQYLRHCITDNKISDIEQLHLNKLKVLLKLDDSEVEDLHSQVASEIYKKFYNDIIADGKIENTEVEFLDELHKNLRLPTEVVDQISNQSRQLFLQNMLNKIASEGKISPEDWGKLVLTAHNLDVNIKLDDSTKFQVEKLKMFWNIEHGKMPIIEVPLNLQKDELCFYKVYTDWLENRTITKRINYEGPTARIRIAKGFYYRAGSIGIQRMTAEQLITIDSGVVYITNKRIIFTGKKKNFNVQLNKILSINPFSDGVEIEKDSGKSPIFKLDLNADLFAMILNRLINDPNISDSDDNKGNLNNEEMTTEVRIYKSSKQSVYKGTDEPHEVTGLKVITIDNNQFIVELPDNTILKGTLTFDRQDEDKSVYITDAGCSFVISNDSILLNLYATHNAAYNYILDK